MYLNRRMRLVLIMRYTDGLTIPEIAQVLEVQPLLVKMILARARAIMRLQLIDARKVWTE